MTISLKCGNYGKPFNVGPEVAGKTGRRKRCGALVTISHPVPTRAMTSTSSSSSAASDRFPPRTPFLSNLKPAKKKQWWKASKSKSSGEPATLARFGKIVFAVSMVLGLASRTLWLVQGFTVVFAPAVDLEKQFGPETVRELQSAGAGYLATRYSPKTNIGNLHCP